jgi:putative ABC transport system permease protein
VRTTVSILAVALEVALILVVVGLITGAATETGKRIEGVGADIIVQPPNASYIFALNSSPMPMAYSAKFAEIEGVKAVAPVLTMTNSKSSGLEVIYGIDPPSFDSVSGGLTYIEGRLFKDHTDPIEVVVDDWYARSRHTKVGDQIHLLGHEFRVSGIVQHGKGSRIFMPLKAAQEMQGFTGNVSMFYVKLHNPDDVDAVIDRIHLRPGFSEFKLTPLREFASLMMSDNQALIDNFYDAVIFVAACIGVLVIFLSMYTTITERTREIGILRSLGASKRLIVTLILQEAFTISVLGVVIGLGSSFVIGRVVQTFFPTSIISIPPEWMLRASIFAVLSGLIGAVYPSVKAAAHDPVEALAYE